MKKSNTKTAGERKQWFTALLFTLLFLVTPGAMIAQNISGITLDTGNAYPEEEIEVTLDVTGFHTPAAYRYFVVYDYTEYDELLRFTHNTAAGGAADDVDVSGLVAGVGQIIIKARVPKQLYRYSTKNLAVLVINTTTNIIEYVLDEPVVEGSIYPATGDYYVGNKNFENYNKQARIYEAPKDNENGDAFTHIYEVENGSSFSFTLFRNNPQPAVKNDIIVQYSKDGGAWQNIRTVNLNEAGTGLPVVFNSGDPDWPVGIEGLKINIRVIQTDGQLLSSGIDTWRIEDFEFFNIVGEPGIGHGHTQVFGNFWVNDLVVQSPITPFTTNKPDFTLTNFNIDAVDLYPGVTVKYEITSGTNVAFPNNTVCEVYLYNLSDGETILIDNFSATELPLATQAKEFTFNLPFRPKANWRLYVRADVRDDNRVTQTGSFQILDVNLSGNVNLNGTPANEKLELDGSTYLYQGSTLQVDYALGGGETINTADKDVQIILEYQHNAEWIELKTQAFSTSAIDQEIITEVPVLDGVAPSNLNLRLRLVYGSNIDLQTFALSRAINTSLPYNYDNFDGDYGVGSNVGFHVFVKTPTAQNIVIECKQSGTWTQIGIINAMLDAKTFIPHFAVNSYDFIPSGDVSINNPQFRIRWAEGGPVDGNIAIVKGYRIQKPFAEQLKQSGTFSFNLLNPYLTLSPNIQDYYEFPVEKVGEEYVVTAKVGMEAFYNTYGLNAGTEISAVLVNKGDNPETGDSYYYLGSKAVVADGEDNLEIQLNYDDVKTLFGDELPFGLYQEGGKALLNTAVYRLNDYTVGEAQTLQFELFSSSPDEEYIDQFEMEFPAGVSVDAATNIIGLNSNISGQKITWSGGSLDPDAGESYMFTVDVTIDAGFTGSLTIPWHIQGNNWGVAPHTDNGVVFLKPSELFDIQLYATDKAAADPIQFMQYQSNIGFKTGYNTKPMVITDAIDLTAYTTPLYLTYTWNDGAGINPLNDHTRPSLEYTVNEGVDWIEISTYPFNEQIDITVDMISTNTRFRWTQEVELGNWSVSNVKLFSGESNLVAFNYTKVGMPVTVALARQNIDPPVVVIDPCEEFNMASLDKYEFATAVENVAAGSDFDFTWNFLMENNPAKIISNQEVAFSDTYVYGLNAMSVNLQFNSTKKITEFKLTFPEGVTPTLADSIMVDGNKLQATIDDIARTITWASVNGSLQGAVNYDVNIEFTVVNTITDDISVDWSLTDADETQNGTAAITPSTAFPQGTTFTFEMNYSGWTEIVGNVTETGTVTATIPSAVPTGSYSIRVTAEYKYLDAFGVEQTCGTQTATVYTELFVVQPIVPEALEIALQDVNFDPAMDYFWGKPVDITFETFGPWQDEYTDLNFEVVLSDGTNLYNLGNVPVQIDNNLYNVQVNLIQFADFIQPDPLNPVNNADFTLQIRAYLGDGEYIVTNLHAITSFFAANDVSLIPGGFTNNGTQPYAITEKLPLAQYAGQEVFFTFNYNVISNITPNLQTLPQLHVSLDNFETFEVIELDQSAFGTLGRLDHTGNVNYRYPIDNAYLSDEIRFRLYQEIGNGTWEVTNVNIERPTNEVDRPTFANYYSDLFGTFNIKTEPTDDYSPYIVYDKTFSAYEWELVDADLELINPDLDPAITVGEGFTYNWTIDPEMVDVDGYLLDAPGGNKIQAVDGTGTPVVNASGDPVYMMAEWPAGSEFEFFVQKETAVQTYPDDTWTGYRAYNSDNSQRVVDVQTDWSEYNKVDIYFGVYVMDDNNPANYNPGEFVELQYSIDNGASWISVSEYPFAGIGMNNTNHTVTLPDEAITNNTQLRFYRQTFNGKRLWIQGPQLKIDPTINAINYFHFATTDALGTYMAANEVLPIDFETGNYAIGTRAFVYESVDVIAHGSHGEFDGDTWVNEYPMEFVGNELVINNGEVTPEHYSVSLDSINANNADIEIEVGYETEYHFGGQIVVNYQTFGPYGADVRFETVLEGIDINGQPFRRNLLVNGSETGIVQKTILIPTRAELEEEGIVIPQVPMSVPAQYNVSVKVYAFNATVDNPNFVKDVIELASLTSGANFYNLNNGAGVQNLNFTGTDIDNNKRAAVTRKLSSYVTDTEIDFHKLIFTYTEGVEITPVVEQTIPKFEVSIDGGVNYVLIERLFTTGDHEFALTQNHLDNADNIHFRWVQDYSVGEWTLSGIKFIKGETNQHVPAVESATLPIVVYNIPSNELDNLNAYVWELVDQNPGDSFEAVVNLGESFQFEWNYARDNEGGIVGTVWPAETVFDFYLVEPGVPDIDHHLTSGSNIDATYDVTFDTLPEYLMTGNYQIKVVATAYDAGGNILLNDNGFEIIVDEIKGNPFVINTGVILDDPNGIDLEMPLAVNTDPLDNNFYFGGQVAIHYETYGTFEIEGVANVRFEMVVENLAGNIQYNLGNQANFGIFDGNFNIPSKVELETAGFDFSGGAPYQVNTRVYAYSADVADEDLLINEVVLANVDMNADVVANTMGQNASPRYVITESLEYFIGEAQVLDYHKLKYEINGYNVAPFTAQTLPRLEISEDAGVTYPTVLEWIFDNNDYYVELTQAQLDNAANVHFRWKQSHPIGTWNVANVSFVKGKTNYEQVAIASMIQGPITLDMVMPAYPLNLDNYELQVTQSADNDGVELPVIVDTDNDFIWAVKDLTLTDEIFPVGTLFTFTLTDDGGNIMQDEEGVDYVWNLFDEDSFMANLPADLFATGVYHFDIEAYVEGEFDVNNNPTSQYATVTGSKTIFVINEIDDIDVRRLVVEALDPTVILPALPTFDAGQEFTINFQTYGPWPENTVFSASLEQIDAFGNYIPYTRKVLETVTSGVILPGTLTVRMPQYVIEHEDFAKYQVILYPFEGTVAFGDNDPMEVEVLTVEGDNNDLIFANDGNRFALTDTLNLSEYTVANIKFDYIANGLPENPNTLPRLMVSIDGGETFTPLEIDPEVSIFGAMGYLPSTANMTIYVDILAEYLTEETQFKFVQGINQGDNQDVWSIDNVEIVGDNNLINVNITPQDVNINFPTLANYKFRIVRDVDGFEPVFYSGHEVEFTLTNIDDNGDTVGVEFPLETTFEFFLDGYADEPWPIETTLEAGIYSFTLPVDIIRGAYDVFVHITYSGNVIVDIIDEVQVPSGTINVYNPVLFTQQVSQEVVYAGSNTSFIGSIENNVVPIDATLFYNLIVTDNNGDEWLLDYKVGSLAFDDAQLLPFINGNVNFKTEASIDGSMGVVGEKLLGTQDAVFDWGTFDFTGIVPEGERYAEAADAMDLTNWTYLELEVMFPNPNLEYTDYTDAQKLVLEYSANNGVTYQNIATYPDHRFIAGEWVTDLIEIPENARQENVIVRLRIEEYKEGFEVRNVAVKNFTSYTKAPIESKATNVFVAKQRINVTSSNAIAYCNDGAIEVDYAVRGEFGANTQMDLQLVQGLHSDPSHLWFASSINYWLGSYDVNYPGAEVTFDIKAAVGNGNIYASSHKLRLQYSINSGGTWYDVVGYPDAVYTDNQWNTKTYALPTHALTTNTYFRWYLQSYVGGRNFEVKNLEIKATYEDNTFAGVTQGQGSFLLDLTTIDSPLSGRNIKMRINAEDNTKENYEYNVYGSTSEIGVDIVDEIDPNVSIIPKAGYSETCSNVERVAVINNAQPYFKYRLRNYTTGTWIGEAVVANPDDALLTTDSTLFGVYPYYDGVSSLQLPVGLVTSKTKVEVIITAQDATGTLVCDEKSTVIPAEFDIRQQFALHYDFDGSGNAWLPVNQNQEYTICQDGQTPKLAMVYWKNGQATISSNISWYRTRFGTTMLVSIASQYEITENGTYHAIVDDGLCGIYVSDTINVIVNDKPEQPTITAEATQVCSGQTVVITANETYSYYRWYKDNGIIVGNTNTQSLIVEESGNYNVEVSNVPFTENCFSVKSNPVYIDVVEYNDITLAATSIELCYDTDSVANIQINNIQDGVTYQLRDESTGDVFATAYGYGSVYFTTLPISFSGQRFVVYAVNTDLDCEQLVSGNNRIEVTIAEQYLTLVKYSSLEWEIPSNEGVYCENTTIGVGTAEFNTNLNGGFVTWYRDGYSVSISPQITMPAPGTYKAKYTKGDCEYFTEEIVINAKPEQPVITYEGSLELCENDQVVLSAPIGFTYYRWYFNNIVTGANSQTITVVGNGAYTVEVSNLPFDSHYGCVSDMSEAVVVNAVNFMNINFAAAATGVEICEAGNVTIALQGAVSPDFNYQLVDLLTGDLVGMPFTMVSNPHNINVSISEYSELGLLATHVELGCQKMMTSTLTVSLLPQYITFVNEGGINIPYNGETYCEGATLSVCSEDGQIAPNSNVTWYKNGVHFSNNATIDADLPGTYRAKYSAEIGTCFYFTDPVTIGGMPARPTLAINGPLSFCEGSGELTLTATEGFTSYEWYQNGNRMFDVSFDDNELQVTSIGTFDYTVIVINENGCTSDESLPITATVHALPDMPLYNQLNSGANNNVLCQPGSANVILTGWIGGIAFTPDDNVMYQLYDAITGEPSGAARLGAENLVLRSDTLTQDATLEVRARRIDVQTCEIVSLPMDIYVYNLSIMVSGNTLTASIPPFNNQSVIPTGAVSYQWYRNGTMITYDGNRRSVTIFDNAQYSVVVETIDGCILTYSVNKNDIIADESETVSAINIYPNPVKNQLSVCFGEIEGDIQLRIISFSGQLIRQINITRDLDDEEQTIDVQDLNQGIYMLQVVTEGKTEVKRFIKK